MINVLVNATSARLGGGLTTLRNVLRAFVETDGGSRRYTVVALAETFRFLDPGHERVTFVSKGQRHSLTRRLLVEQIGVPLRAALARFDVVLSPANIAVISAPVPQVLMFRNMAPFDPDVVAACPPRRRVRLELLKAAGIVSAHAARKIVFISEYARDATLPQLRVDAAKATCIHLGRAPEFCPAASDRASPILERLGVRPPYLLAVGNFYQHKNFVELVVGFSRARASLPPEVRLVIAGDETEPDYAALVRRTIVREGLEGHVVLTGAVAYADLPPLYAASSIFLFPSRCENFPNILIEGLASGVATLSSSAGPMPEIAGDGAEYFHPFEPDEIAAGIVRLWCDRAAARNLAERGLERAGRFTWEETARRLGRVLDEAAA